MGSRKGFILANLSQGSGITMWKAMRDAFLSSGDDALFVFPGGRLDFKEGSEHLRNGIYSLASPDNIDELVIWASSLAGAVGKDAVADAVWKKSIELPSVSIGMEIADVASVDFDAYSGMASEISHFIHSHNQRRIAFLRGPDTHESAEQRYRAYADELENAGIPFDSALVSSPHPWSEGAEAIRELVEGRGLVPGKDFTALATASDLLLFGAYGYLSSIGIRIPEDLITGGFNGNEENILMNAEPTTVLMPIHLLANTAYSLVSSGSVSHVSLPAELQVNQSCGCSSHFPDRDSFLVFLEKRTQGGRLRELALAAIEAADSSSPGLAACIEDFIMAGGDSLVISSYAPLMADSRPLYEALAGSQRRVNARDKIRTRRLGHVLDEFKNSLLGLRSFADFPALMESCFPALGIRSAFIVLYQDFSDSALKGGFSPSGRFSECVFHRRHLLPLSLSGEISKGIFAIEPLFYDNQELGYILLDASEAESSLLEDIRAAVSSSVRSIKLSEETRIAKEAAEEGEQAALDFYARVSEGIRQSLTEIRRKLIDDKQPRQAIFDTLIGAENLLELSLAEYEDIECEKRFINASLIVSDAVSLGLAADAAPSALPSVEADRELLKKAFSAVLFMMGGKASFSVSLSPSFIEFMFSGRVVRNDRNPLLLAEKYVIIHSGSLVTANDSVAVRLPFPSFSGSYAVPENGGSIIYIASGDDDEVPDALLPLEPLRVPVPHLSELLAVAPRLSAVSWTGGERKDSGFIVNMLRSHRNTRSIPCICFGEAAGAMSFISAVDGRELPVATAVFVIGEVSVPPIIGEYGMVSAVSSFEEAAGADGDVRMIFIEGIRTDLIMRFRSHQRFASVPIVAISDSVADAGFESIEEIPALLIVNSSILEASGFISRLVAILAGSPMLPPLTGVIVKKAIAYMNRWARKPVTRWKIADAVNISEDYLTRIFRKEMGLSPWEYLNRYRIQLASALLSGTGMPMGEVARETGFQDQAYFCRVFKKVKGVSPRQLRKRS